MRACVYITDPGWIAALEQNGIRNSVNFWRKDQRGLDLLPGDFFYFKLRGSMAVAGRAYFREQIQLTLPEAWARFGLGNGVPSLAEFASKVKSTLRLADESINCLILDGVEMLPVNTRPSINLNDFPRGIMNGKFFEGDSLGYIEAFFSNPLDIPALAGMQHDTDDNSPFDPRYLSTVRASTLRSVCARRGQARFRAKLITAYESRCCVTGETASAVLEAAHIHPYSGTDTDVSSNGLLIRSDWHTLFDLGLWTLGGDFAIKISRQLANTAYSSHEGKTITLPNARDARPSQAALKYHRDKIFRS